MTTTEDEINEVDIIVIDQSSHLVYLNKCT